MTIDDLLNKPQLTGAQAQLGERRLRQRRQNARQKTQKPKTPRFQDSKLQDFNTPLANPSRDTAAREEDGLSPLTRGRSEGGQEEPRENVLENKEQEQQAGASLRERVMQAKAKEQEDKLQDSKSQTDKAGAGAKFSTSALLKASWLNLIDSFGATLIYINIHVFLRWVLGEKFFCKLGEEWVPKQAEAAAGQAGKAVSKNAGIVEAMVLIVLDLIAGAVIIGALSLIVMIVTWMGESWWGKLTMLWQALWGLGWGAVKVLVDLFS
ncbi:hypothetical protein COU01_01110 [Candidatus Falkowbacteria bacterium CG10_big_fil_rev_8_21_14_0_10_44_15]|uniref:Uncharacterized protein n=1 Tax=Candidatus Falkowbacteria bacterium CG10_big_fil_rev_8_21_14_0_10_44_15 TaxID=1974569 RepID=A0A2H0V0C8_9BACT|nr:MAG: hypothetical protein COU01_01110 [Candidatus Falkowbacteria bacterium CG10_big_fil_rev_8_21_14_0_10_44_15]